jgi:hypothetical protein
VRVCMNYCCWITPPSYPQHLLSRLFHPIIDCWSSKENLGVSSSDANFNCAVSYIPLDQDEIEPSNSFQRFRWELGNLDPSSEIFCCIHTPSGLSFALEKNRNQWKTRIPCFVQPTRVEGCLRENPS